MKKQYISPSTLVFAISHQMHILAGSPGISTNERAASESSEVLSRQTCNIWDDEDFFDQ